MAYEIDGMHAPWIQVETDTLQGWVFGAYMEPSVLAADGETVSWDLMQLARTGTSQKQQILDFLASKHLHWFRQESRDGPEPDILVKGYNHSLLIRLFHGDEVYAVVESFTFSDLPSLDKAWDRVSAEVIAHWGQPTVKGGGYNGLVVFAWHTSNPARIASELSYVPSELGLDFAVFP